MDETTLKRATEPFFTTKGLGKGTGLGLSMVDGLVAQSGGAMRISSRVGIGTTIELWLPASSGEEKPKAVPAALFDRAAAVACRVLVVDDDPIILAGTTAMLEDLGHSVTEAASGASALDLLHGESNFDLVLTDHAMPGMTGTQLAAQIQRNWPALPIIIASGYAEFPSGENPSLPRLAKPYRQGELASLIGSLLAQRPTGNVVPIGNARRS
jgi:CheY-like chemotaxis protein